MKSDMFIKFGQWRERTNGNVDLQVNVSFLEPYTPKAPGLDFLSDLSRFAKFRNHSAE